MKREISGGLLVAELDSLYQEFKALVKDEGLKLSDALKVITQNSAKSLKFYPKKGAIQIGSERGYRGYG